MRLVEVLAALSRHIRFVAVIAVLGLITGAFLAAIQSSSYEATARIAIGPDDNIADQNDRIQAGHVLNQAIIPSNLSELLVSERVLTTALAEAGLQPVDVENDTIEAIVAPDSNIVYLSVTSSDANRPEQLVGPITEAGIELFEEIYDVYRAEVIQLDRISEEEPSFGIFTGSIIGLLFGLLVATYVVLFFDRKMDGNTPWVGSKPSDFRSPPPISQGNHSYRSEQVGSSSKTRYPDGGDIPGPRRARTPVEGRVPRTTLFSEPYKPKPTVAQLAAITGEIDLVELKSHKALKSRQESTSHQESTSANGGKTALNGSARDRQRNGADEATETP